MADSRRCAPRLLAILGPRAVAIPGAPRKTVTRVTSSGRSSLFTPPGVARRSAVFRLLVANSRRDLSRRNARKRGRRVRGRLLIEYDLQALLGCPGRGAALHGPACSQAARAGFPLTPATPDVGEPRLPTRSVCS